MINKTQDPFTSFKLSKLLQDAGFKGESEKTMKQINTHKDLLNVWYNVENPEFNVYDDRKPNIVIGANGTLYNVLDTGNQYVIQERMDYILNKLTIGHLEFEELARVDTPQAVYDYFKPFMEDKRVD